MTFDAFWSAYPTTRKVNKKGCLAIWERAKLDTRANDILAHVHAMKRSDQWRKGFSPLPATYLNQERWNDGVPDEPSDEPMSEARQFLRELMK